MKNQNKYNIFEPMSKTFETDIMRKYFLDMVQEIPDYIFTMPSSTSGKYHNKTQCETYGQIYHVYMFSEILNYRLNLKGNKEKYNNPILRDCMRCIPAFHDAIKCGLNGSQYTVHEHPILAQEWVLNTKVEHDIDIKLKKLIGDMCAAHSGEWTSNKRSKVVLPEPKNDMELFIHECDILSSRNNIDLIISDELKTLLHDNFPVKVQLPDINEYKMPFGKHKGQLLKDVPIDYIEWLAGTELKEPLKSMVNEILNDNTNNNEESSEINFEDNRELDELPFK